MIKLLLALFVGGSAMASFALHHPGHTHVPLIVAHRGASHDAPENTLAAFKLAWEQGADAIEGDFYLTADGRVTALHDATFKRTGGVDRKPIDMTLDEIRTIDVGSWKDARFAGERAPTLDEVLAIVPKGKQFLIEIKCGPEVIPAMKKAIESSGVPLDQLRLICFNADVIAESKKVIPELKAYWLTSFKAPEGETEKRPTLKEIRETLERVKADGVDAKADLDVVDELFIATFRQAGYELHFWTVDDPAVAKRLVELGVDSITTNRPAFLREAIAR